jgi:tight adherence protein B
MMQFLVTAAGFAVMAGVVVALVGSHRRQRALGRMDEQGVLDRRAGDDAVVSRGPILRRHRWIAIAVGTAVSLAATLILFWPVWLSIAIGFVVSAVAWIVEDFIAGSKQLKVEEQVADAIDLAVSALKSGMSLVDGLRIASEEARKPLKPAIEEIVQRLDLGDDPDTVFHDFSLRVPVETAGVLAFTLTVHWRVGGGLARALASVSQGARHRIEFHRRVRSQATEGRASLIGMLGITYVLTLMLWRAYPDRFEGFFGSSVGVALTTTVLVLQGLGLVWTTALTRIKA